MKRVVNYETDGFQGSTADYPPAGVYHSPKIVEDRILFEGVLSIMPVRVERIVRAWGDDLRRKYKYVIESGTSEKDASRTDIKALAMYGVFDEARGGYYYPTKGFELLGKISTYPSKDGMHVTLSFYDWEEEGEEIAELYEMSMIPHAAEIFEDLAGRLRAYELIKEPVAEQNLGQENVLPPSYAEDLQKVKELSLIPLTITQISLRLGLSISTIKRYRKKLGLSRRKK